MNKELTPLELWKNFLLLVEAPAKARLFDCEWKDGLEQYDYFKAQIENALKNYEELTNKPVILYGRTHGYTKALIDTICKNYKEVKITNLEDEKKLKAFEVIKNKKVNIHSWYYNNCNKIPYEIYKQSIMVKTISDELLTQEEFDLLKEVLL